ncbi:mannose-1-phosphate guanylyltransferase (GDP) [Algoriphagus ornithinivorans]|uniref:mannose-1-phosphate guanylyltransferase n=1 Tax=Algoriphagus ornithinivorans TaxID=226506 RepID=A0A1I5AKL8_9BACT|nr:mannose-1-phosphate guanylyltransferase [Algoriphagus ornithinivorans]SFN62958.1 mannose-1-phosphate guanylyltransferase (GDP) [Algoriphagus ornithinivorans]
MQEKPYIIIMAGGIGTRFWPHSRRKRPKQFLDILGTGRSLLQMTYDRFLEVADKDRFFVITYKKYVNLVKEQLPELEDHQILSEPNRKNTATCIAYACYKVNSIDPGASMIVTPADHLILQEGKFVKTIQKALKEATIEGRLITVGIKPNRPETGYGYIQYLESKNSEEALKVKTFTEKPNSKLAKTFIESGDFVWNSGIFVWKCSSLLSSFQKHMPDVAEIFDEGKEFFGKDAELDFVSKAYLQVKNISIDYGLMEKSSDVYVILGDFGWSDLGSWYSLHELREKDEHNNVVEANAMLYDTENSFIKVDSEKLVVVEGLKNYLINETENVLLICPLDGEKKFRDFVSNARKKGEDFI